MSYDEIPPEEQESVIEEVAKKLVDAGLDEIAALILPFGYPFAYIGGEMSRIFIGPYTVILGKYENSFDKYISIFEKRENIRKLINRIDILGDEKRKEKKREAEKNGTVKRGLFSRLWEKLKSISL